MAHPSSPLPHHQATARVLCWRNKELTEIRNVSNRKKVNAPFSMRRKQRKKLHDRLRQSLRSERNNMVNIANGPHHPNPPSENVQLVNVGWLRPMDSLSISPLFQAPGSLCSKALRLLAAAINLHSFQESKVLPGENNGDIF